MRAALYVRVSTTGQTVDNQLRELRTAARRHGWKVVQEFEDRGISGRSRAKRPGLVALMKGVARKDFDLVAAWSIDRIGRDLKDLIDILQELREKRVNLYLHQQGVDTSTANGKLQFQLLGMFAEFELNLIRERVNAGLARAKEKGTRLGRPPRTSGENGKKIEAAIKAERAKGAGMHKIADSTGVSISVVQRVLGYQRPKRPVRENDDVR